MGATVTRDEGNATVFERPNHDFVRGSSEWRVDFVFFYFGEDFWVINASSADHTDSNFFWWFDKHFSHFYC